MGAEYCGRRANGRAMLSHLHQSNAVKHSHEKYDGSYSATTATKHVNQFYAGVTRHTTSSFVC
jgi:hypothetical protein